MTTPFFLFLGDLGGSEIMLILVVVLIFFGAKRIPELALGLGTGIRELKAATNGLRTEMETASQPKPVAPVAAPAVSRPVEQIPLS